MRNENGYRGIYKCMIDDNNDTQYSHKILYDNSRIFVTGMGTEVYTNV